MSDFERRWNLDSIRDGERIALTANDDERRVIAERLGLVDLSRLEANATLDRDGDRIRARGRLQAAAAQPCVVTGDPVAEHVDAQFDLLFVPEPRGSASEEEIELTEQDCDVLFHDGATIDLGLAIADTLALSLDPYPRSAGAEAALKEAGVLTQEQAGPFAALEELKRRLAGKES